MTVNDVSRRADVLPSGRSFKSAPLSLGSEALTALYGALRESRALPGGPQDTPEVRLHKASNRRQALESDDPEFRGPGSVFAYEARQAARDAAAVAARAAAAAAGGNVEDLISTNTADDLAEEARMRARAATQVALTAAQAARANPQNAGLAQAAAQARENAAYALQYAVEAEASRASTYRYAADLLAMRAVDAADATNNMANAAIDAAADRLEAAGGDPHVVAALRALRTPSALELNGSDLAAASHAFDEAMSDADDLGRGDLRTLVVHAQRLRAYAVNGADAAGAAVGHSRAAQASEETALAAAQASEGAAPGNTGARVIALRQAKAAGDTTRARWVNGLSEEISAGDFRGAADAVRAAALGNLPGAGANPLTVEEPEGEPGELDIGGTDVTIDEVVPAQAHSQADAALTDAGAAAGAAAHTDIRTAVDTHGPADRAAIAEAAEASLWKRSQALAAQMLEHPAVKNVLRLTGRGLEGAALAAMVYGLAKAIHTDVRNGDHSAPATRKALAELLGGLSLGLGGAAVGARVGAALGALVGPVTAAVGGFVGGLFGGALGFAAGTRLVDRALENNQQPLDHLIDSVLDQQGDIAAVNAGAVGALQTLTGSGSSGQQGLPGRTPEPQAPAEPSHDQLNLAQRVVQAGSTNDGYANRKELIAGFEEARYHLQAGQAGSDFSDAFAVNRLIATYGASGSGALTEDELAQALADGALVIHDDGTVTVDTAVLQAQQRSQAGHIASRMVDAGAKAESADEGDLRDGFGDAGYSLKASGEDIEALMRVFGDANGRIGKSELAAAIQVGAVVIAADGTVTVDRAVLGLA